MILRVLSKLKVQANIHFTHPPMTEAVDNDGDHGAEEKKGVAFLKKGYHKIEVKYLNPGGGFALEAFIQKEGGVKNEISSATLFH